jgi:type IV secretory pathway protease TraF
VVITTPKFIYVVEIKIDASPEVALKQIDERGYAVPYLDGERAVYKVGVNFSTKERTISEWKLVEAKGGVE